ncbi:hypothetical protein BKI52_15025 [marine bacterium AO1-C]|nr:hypothetical protein BKI52_15025 [marine bacterium AO1-C]
MKVFKNQIVFRPSYWHKLLGNFGFMAITLFLAFIYFENLQRASIVIIILANLFVGGSVIGFFVLLPSIVRRLEFHPSGIKVYQLVGFKKYEWSTLKSIHTYQNEQKRIFLEFWFQEQQFKLSPENLGAHSNHNLLESRKIIRSLLKTLIKKEWISDRVVNDRLDWVPAEKKPQPQPKFKIAEIVGEVNVTKHEVINRNGREEVVSATRYSSPITKLVIEEGYSDLGRKVTSYGVFFSEKLTGSTYYYDFGVEKYDEVRKEVIFYNVCDHKDKMRLDLPTLRLEKIR